MTLVNCSNGVIVVHSGAHRYVSEDLDVYKRQELLFMGFWCSPAGEIHNSVLVGFGEVSTFSGALFGVDYSYKYKIRRDENGE